MVSKMGTNGQQRTLSLIPGACISVALRLQHAKPQAQKDRVAGALRRFFEFPDVKQELPALGSGAQAEVTVVGTGWACEVCQTRGTQGACVLLVALFGIRRKLGSSYAVPKPPSLVPSVVPSPAGPRHRETSFRVPGADGAGTGGGLH